MKFIKLLTRAYVNGVPKSPEEGVLHLQDDEAQRLIDNGAGQDVSADFTGKAANDSPVEHVTTAAQTPGATVQAESHPHQSEVAPQAAEAHAGDKPKARKAPAHKE